tara:strand:- start:28 stop:483 length:456 start_codon:yes stop_codon:yes gene_type:complete
MNNKMNYVGIPVSDLMCVDMPSSHILTEEGPLTEEEVPIFFNTLQASVSVWANFLARIATCPEGWADSRHEFIAMLRDGVEEVYSNDDPMQAWPLRQKLALMIDQFDQMCDEMARPFTGPATIRQFYHNLASRVRATFEYILNGGFDSECI